MSVLDTLTNNTILIPASDSLVDSNPLPPFDAAKKLEAINTDEIISDHFEYGAYIKLNDGASVKMIAVQDVSDFGMTRENNQMPNTTGDYIINFPGPVKYSDVILVHVYSNDSFFLDWLENGVTQGGSARVDMEMHFWLPCGRLQNAAGIKKKHFVFTLYDAFPVKWEMREMDMSGGKVLTERVTVTFSSMDYKVDNN